ncbi:MAG TPA: hypothetical protein VFS09_01280 [Candidatus Eisenbacteria bacterium]|nr:hypothetical protein [Candidatus Eisenbacteria bacterium]
MERPDSPALPHGPDCSPETARTTPYLIAFAIAYVGALLLLRFVPMPRAAQIAVSLVPVPVFSLYLHRWLGAVRRLDELQRLITLEALGIAYPLALLLIMTIGLLEMVGALRHDVVSYLRLWPLVFWLYFIGLIAARRRYR